MSQAATSPEVEELQELLARAGWYRGQPTGINDEATTAALRGFQQTAGLQVDGIAGPATMERLRQYASGSPPSSTAEDEAVAESPEASASGSSGEQVATPDESSPVQTQQRAPVTKRAARKTVPSADVAREPNIAQHPPPEADGGSDVAAATATPTPTPPLSFVAGFRSDGVVDVDRLGIADDVNTLAAVLADQQLVEPVAIGVFGDWGSGKTFFMRQLQARIALLADASVKAREEQRGSLFCSYPRQIYFNAWLHSDADLWRSLAAAVHFGVAGRDAGAINPMQLEAALGEFQLVSTSRLQELRAEEQASRMALEEAQKDSEQRREVERAAIKDMGAQGSLVADAAATTSELRRFIHSAGTTWRSLEPAGRIGIATIAFAAVVVAAILAVNSRATAAIAAAAVPVAAVLAMALRGLKTVNGFMAKRQDRENAERKEADLRVKVAEANAKTEQEAARVAGEDPRLVEYAEFQAERWTKERQVGLLAQIRERFAFLSERISESRERRETDEPDTGPIDRIIVYIDDLDRCKPDIVVDALEAIKLLMELDHFVVVVAVDPRWLFRSLEERFAAVLASGSSTGDGWAPTPQNYLEKIFQVSISIPPMSSAGFANLIRGLMPVRTTEAAEAPSAADSADLPADGTDTSGVEADTPAVDLEPVGLLLDEEELDLMAQLGGLFDTPRSAKRLTNVYRLIRASLPPESVERLSGGGFAPLLMLLGVSIGHPDEADDVLRVVLSSDPNTRWAEMARSLLPEEAPDAKPPTWRNAVMSDMSPIEARVWRVIATNLTGMQALGSEPVGVFQDWVRLVVRYSFHPWREVAA